MTAAVLASPPTAGCPRVLLVDDERNVIDGLRRQLRANFAIETAVGGSDGLACLRDGGPFDVVVSDYQMPGMNGAAFLAAARQLAPHTTRVLLTGQADLAGAADVVNHGAVFRFLLKPVPIDTLLGAIRAGVEQHRLVTAERELLERTLHGSVKALTELLSLASPAAFARATRLRRLAGLLLDAAGEPMAWHVDLAVMLSQVGAITLPPSLLERIDTGDELDAAEQAMVGRLPAIADQVLADIPRLEEVRAAIRLQDATYAGRDPAAGQPTAAELPLGARVLRIVRDYDILETGGRPAGEALRIMRARDGAYDRGLLDALASALAASCDHQVTAVAVDELKPGMVLAGDIYTESGIKLVPRGHGISSSLLERIRNFSEMVSGVREPVEVFALRRQNPSRIYT